MTGIDSISVITLNNITSIITYGSSSIVFTELPLMLVSTDDDSVYDVFTGSDKMPRQIMLSQTRAKSLMAKYSAPSSTHNIAWYDCGDIYLAVGQSHCDTLWLKSAPIFDLFEFVNTRCDNNLYANWTEETKVIRDYGLTLPKQIQAASEIMLQTYFPMRRWVHTTLKTVNVMQFSKCAEPMQLTTIGLKELILPMQVLKDNKVATVTVRYRVRIASRDMAFVIHKGSSLIDGIIFQDFQCIGLIVHEFKTGFVADLSIDRNLIRLLPLFR